MRGFFLFPLTFLLALQASAQEVSLSPPKTIWDSELDGSAVHVQSGLPCPLNVGSFRRENLQLYDKSGFDVGCDYRGEGSEITLYLTSIDPTKFDEHFAAAKGAIEKRIPTAKPRDASLGLPPGFSWSRASYLIPERDVVTEVLMAPFHGWYLEYRITYALRDEPAVTAAVGDLSGAALKEAGAHFSACEAVPKIERKGRRISDDKEIMTLAMVTGAMMGKVKIVDARDNSSKERVGVSSPVLSCAVGGFSIGEGGYIYWHDIGPQSEVIDMITSVSGGVVIFTQSALPLAALLNSKSASPASTIPATSKYAVILDRKDSWDIMAFFDGMPDMEAFATAALLNRSGALANVSKAGNKISVSMPPTPK